MAAVTNHNDFGTQKKSCHCFHFFPFYCHEVMGWEGFPGSPRGKEPARQCRKHEMWVWSLGLEDPLEKGMEMHSSILAWRIPWTEAPGRAHGVAKSRTRLKNSTHSIMELDAIILVSWMLCFKSPFSLSSFTLIKRPFSLSSLSANRFLYLK